MSDEIVLDAQTYISSKRAAESSGYSQDYIGQLSRSGQILARRVGGLWYVVLDSLNSYKQKADLYKPEVRIQERSSNLDALISFDGKDYVSASKASKLTGYTQDYVGQLARTGAILARQVGNRWYIDREGILRHKKSKDALLAAVQVESVGLKKSFTQSEDDLGIQRYGAPGPVLNYVRERTDLVPMIQDRNTYYEGSRTKEYLVPIRVERSPEVVWEEEEGHYEKKPWISRNTMYSLVVPATILTVVVLVSFNFFSVGSGMLYATRESKNEVQVAGAGSAFLEKITDFLERFLSPELRFTRSD